MNVFILSPGRTATVSIAEALKSIDSYTSSHESRVKYLGDDRVDYPINHFECDNRLVWFLPRLTEKYGKNSVLVKINRERHSVAKSYNKRWGGVRIMKAYSQGILMRKLDENNINVCKDYVDNSYEHIEYFAKDWQYYLEIDLENKEEGINKLFDIIGCSGEGVIEFLNNNSLNKTKSSFRSKMYLLKQSIEHFFYDIRTL